MLILAILISAVLSYLLGSFNSSILVVRLLKHQDIREFGSHNAGLTNTLRCFGKGCAALTLVGDLAKGIVAVLLSKGICELLGTGLTAQNDVHFIGYIAGIFAILGHVFPIYYHCNLEVRFPRLDHRGGMLSGGDVFVPVLAAGRPAHVVPLAQYRTGGTDGGVGHLYAPHQYPAAQSRQ